MDHEYYIKLIENNELAEARTYKGRFIPHKLYKYVSLADKCCEMTLSLNEQKLKSLENEKIWLSTPDNLNDPFELNTLFFDQRKLLYKLNLSITK